MSLRQYEVEERISEPDNKGNTPGQGRVTPVQDDDLWLSGIWVHPPESSYMVNVELIFTFFKLTVPQIFSSVCVSTFLDIPNRILKHNSASNDLLILLLLLLHLLQAIKK